MSGPDEKTRQAIIAEVAQWVGAERLALEDDEFTVRQYMDAQNEEGQMLKYDQAGDDLRRLFDAGRLTRRKANVGGKSCWAYRMVKEGE